MLSNLLIESMTAASVKLLQAESTPGPALCSRIKQLLEKLLLQSTAQGDHGFTNQQLAAGFGKPVASALLPSVTSGHCSAEASDLLAALIDAFGTEVAAAASPAQQAGPRFARGEHHGPHLMLMFSLHWSNVGLCAGAANIVHAANSSEQTH